MKIKIFGLIVTVLIMLFNFGQIKSQTISDNLILVQTDYEIYYNEIKLTLIKQGISKRGAYDIGIDYGSGFQSYHLEFSYNNLDLIIEDEDVAELYDAEGKLLTTIMLWPYDNLYKKTMTEEDIQKRHYSINLIDVPLYLIDEVKRIVIRS